MLASLKPSIYNSNGNKEDEICLLITNYLRYYL